jgi:hypothetical protein
MEIELFPPSDIAPFKKFQLASTGREVAPNFARGGAVVVHSSEEELELVAEGWSRKVGKLDTNDLSKAVRAEAQRSGIVLPMSNRMRDSDLRKAAVVAELRHAGHEVDDPERRTEFGEIEVDHGIADVASRLRVAHDRRHDALVIHGIHVDLDEIDPGQRASLRASSAAFDAAQTAEEQTSAREAIGRIVEQVLQLHQELQRRVKERLTQERFTAV